MIKGQLLITALLFVVLGHVCSTAQNTLDMSHNSMRIGDVVQMYKLDAEDVWNLSVSKYLHKTQYQSFNEFSPDTITCRFDGMRKDYVLQYDSLLYIGEESPTLKESLYIPEVHCIFPMVLDDRYDGCFAAHTSYCDKMKFHKYGTYTVHADSVGTLVLPDGNTIHDVLQITLKRKFTYELVDTCSLIDMPKYIDTVILQKLDESKAIYTETEKMLYAKGYRYPIVTQDALYNPENQLCLRDTYYFPPEEQEILPTDDANSSVRASLDSSDATSDICKEQAATSYIRKDSNAKELLFDCAAYITDHPLSGIQKCEWIISDSNGILYDRNEFLLNPSSIAEVCISYVGLRHGQYVASLIINSQIYQFNFIIE